MYLLSGAGGMMGECDRLRDGLKQAGVRRPIETFHWSRGGSEKNRPHINTIYRC